MFYNKTLLVGSKSSPDPITLHHEPNRDTIDVATSNRGSQAS